MEQVSERSSKQQKELCSFSVLFRFFFFFLTIPLGFFFFSFSFSPPILYSPITMTAKAIGYIFRVETAKLLLHMVVFLAYHHLIVN
jgi:hypothetical protein